MDQHVLQILNTCLYEGGNNVKFEAVPISGVLISDMQISSFCLVPNFVLSVLPIWSMIEMQQFSPGRLSVKELLGGIRYKTVSLSGFMHNTGTNHLVRPRGGEIHSIISC